MKICLLNDSFPPVIDGVANVVMNYARIMQEELGAEVLVATPEYPGVQYEGVYPYEVVPYKSLDTSKLVNGYRTGNPLALKAIKRIKEFQPDILHVHCPASSAILGRILRRETGAPILFTYHTKFDVDIIRAVGEGFLEDRVVDAMIDNVSACDAVWAVSDGAGKNLQSLGYKGEYSVVTNGVDFPKGRVEEKKVQEVTGGYDLPEGVPVYLFVGRMMKYKGLPMIIEAMGQLAEKGQDFRMVFIGGGADADEMQKKVMKLGLAMDILDANGRIIHTDGSGDGKGRVIFTGPIHDREKLRAWNSRADLFLFPSVYDTNGIVVREAAACGLASVLIKDSCAAEGITDGQNGFLIEENAEAMAACLTSTGMDRMHEAGRHAMDEIYISWEDNVRDVYKRYEKICEEIGNGSFVTKKDSDDEAWLKAAEGIVKVSEKVFEWKDGVHIWRDGMRSNAAEFLDRLPEQMKQLRAGVREFRESARENMREITESAVEGMIEGVKFLGGSTIDGLREIGENVENGARQVLGKKDSSPKDSDTVSKKDGE